MWRPLERFQRNSIQLAEFGVSFKKIQLLQGEGPMEFSAPILEKLFILLLKFFPTIFENN